jgi:hypothetical protein
MRDNTTTAMMPSRCDRRKAGGAAGKTSQLLVVGVSAGRTEGEATEVRRDAVKGCGRCDAVVAVGETSPSLVRNVDAVSSCKRKSSCNRRDAIRVADEDLPQAPGNGAWAPKVRRCCEKVKAARTPSEPQVRHSCHGQEMSTQSAPDVMNVKKDGDGRNAVKLRRT